MRKLFIGISLLTAASACATEGGGPASEPPVLKVTSPSRGTVQSGLADVEVRGTVTPSLESGAPVERVEVNGVRATVDLDGGWVARVPVGAGATMLKTVAVDAEGGEARDTRTVQAGNLVPLNTTVTDGITAAISDDAFARIGEMAGNLIATMDLGTMVQQMNPVVDSGGGPDCLYAQAFIRDLDMASANIGLIPYQGGLTLQAELFSLDVPLDTQYAVACLDGSTAVRIRADRIFIQGDLAVTVAGGALDVSLGNITLDIDGLDIDASGVPGTIIDMLALDSVIQWVAPYAVELFMGPMINDALGGLAMVGPLNLDVAGRTLEMGVTPTAIEFSPVGGELRMNSRFFVQGAESAPGYIFTENGVPAMDAADGFQLALADDAINQLMTGFHAVGAMNMEIPHRAGHLDALAVNALLPPMMSASGTDGTMKLIVGDMMVTAMAQGSAQARLAFNVEVEMAMDSTGNVMKLALQPPVIHIDTTDEIPNVTGFTDDQLEAINGAVIQATMDHLLPLVGAIPLPTLAGVALVDLDVNGINGYVTVTGALE
jgi:hypothetical protein